MNVQSVCASTIELKSSENKIIIDITENDIALAAGKVYMEFPSSWSLSEPFGTGFFSQIYAVKGNNSQIEFQFFDMSAASTIGELEIPFYAPLGNYSVKLEKIELYNKSDFLIPFNYPLEIRVAITDLQMEDNVYNAPTLIPVTKHSEESSGEQTSLEGKESNIPIIISYPQNLSQPVINETTPLENKTVNLPEIKYNPFWPLVFTIIVIALSFLVRHLLKKHT